MSAAGWNESALRVEAAYFHRAIFRLPIPAAVSERYVELHNVCFPEPDAAQRITVERIVALSLDPEAIECSLRFRQRGHLLSRKMQALLYLVEVRRNYYPCFFNDSAAPLRGKFRLLGAILSGIVVALKGEWQIWRYRID